MKRRANPESEKGQSLVELAIMLVFLLILLAGVVDLGRMMFEYQAMRDAAQEGAGYGSLYPSYCDEIENRVMQNLEPTGYTVGVTINDSGSITGCAATPSTSACENKEIIIAIDHNYLMTMPFFAGTNVPMHVEIRDRIVRPTCNP